MAEDRDVHVHLLPELAAPERLRDGVAVVIDVLRATTTVVHALAAGCRAVTTTSGTSTWSTTSPTPSPPRVSCCPPRRS